MAEKIKHKLTGPRNGVELFHTVADLMEKHPEVKMPQLEIGFGYKSDTLRFHAFGNGWGEEKRLNIEQSFNTIMAAFGEDLDWVSNNPSEDSFARDYFIMSTVIRGVEVQILTERSSVGEKVEAVEVGPQIIEAEDGTLQAIQQTVTVWKPNIHLSTLARRGFELGAAPMVKALTA